MPADPPTLLVSGIDGQFSAMVVEFTVMPDAAAAFAAHLAEATQRFISLGRLGGFAVAGLSDGDFVPRVSSPGDGHVFSLQFPARGVNVWAFQILRNMAYWLRTLDVYVSRIRVLGAEDESQSWRLVPPPDDENEDDVYPQLSEPLGFDVQWEEAEGTRVRRCLVEHARSLEESDVRAIAERIEPWFDVIEWGGFSLPAFIPHEQHSLRGSVTQFDETTIEVVVFRYFGSEALWPPLLNVIEGYGRAVCPVTRVTIE